MPAAHSVRIAESPADIARCLPVMKELRPHLTTPEEFVARVQLQNREAGYQLAFATTPGGEVAGVGGFRVGHYLAWGHGMYIDDLSTAERFRSQGYGGAVLEFLIAHAKSLGCDQLHLDSGVHRFAAHRFYLTHRMDITSHHFAIKLR